MNPLLTGMMYAWPAGVWIAGVVVALAWASRGVSTVRLAVLALALLWPALPLTSRLLAQHEARQAAEQFAILCAKQAHERILRRSELVTAIFVEGGSGIRSGLIFRYFESEIWSKLTLEQPGYREVDVVGLKDADGSVFYSARERGQPTYAGPPARKPLGEGMARYGVRFEFQTSATNKMVREFHVAVIDRQTNEVLAEQRSFLYRAPDIVIGGYPLWRRQERTCPLAHPADFVRAALPPRNH